MPSRVQDREADLGRPGQVEADLGGVAVAVAVGRELLRLGREADHERELALELLRDEERRDRRKHQQREHRADDGTGHGRGTLVVENVGRMRVQLIDPSADVLPYDHALAAALGAPRSGRGAGHVALRARPRAGPRRLRGDASPSTGSRPARRPRHPAPAAGAEARRARARHAARCAAAPARPTSSTGSGSGSRRVTTRLLPRDRPQVLTMHNVIRRGRLRAAGCAERMDAVIVHTRHGAELLGARARAVHVIPHGAFEHLTHQADERPLPPELAAVEGPVVLCFGVVRPYKGVDVLVEAFRSIAGAELWVVGRPLGVSTSRRSTRLPNVRFVPRYVSRRRAARLLPARRPAGAAPPDGRRVRRAVRGARVRQADGALRRGRLPRGGGGARRRPAGRARATRRALARGDRRAAGRPGRARAAGASAPAPPRPAPTPGTRSPSARWPSTRRCSRREGRVHGQEQALRGAALDWLVERGVDVPAVVAPEPDESLTSSSGSTSPRAGHGLTLMSEAELYARPAAATWTWSSRSCSGT